MKTKQIIAGFLLLIVSIAAHSATVEAAFRFPDEYNLVAILAEQGAYSDTQDYEGLAATNRALPETTLKARIDRYAQDIQNQLEKTRVVIIQTDRFEKTEHIAAVLERLYREGDPQEPGRIAKLRGVVIIGEVPLPVVNKNGNRFVSLFPYADFDDPLYVFTPETGEFEARGELASPQAEIWHGVIRQNSREELAAYFDKNHLYHTGDPAYSTFGKRVFFQDFIAEAKNFSKITYQNYLAFLEHQDDVAYLRYTKELFKDLSALVAGEDSVDEEIVAAVEDSGIPLDDSVPETPPVPAEFAGDGQPQEVNKDDVPDIITKIAKMSDNLMLRFNQLFTKYPGMINDLMNSTGRYGQRGVDSASNLITAKDQYVGTYLKEVNTRIEDRIDTAVRQLQKDIPFTTVSFKVTSVQRKIGDEGGTRTMHPEPIPAEPDPIISLDPEDDPRGCNPLNRPLDPIHGLPIDLPLRPELPDIRAPEIEFTNFVPGIKIREMLLPCRDTDDTGGSDELVDNEKRDLPNHINGYELNEITSVEQCTLLRGSRGGKRYSKVVEANRALDLLTAKEFFDEPDEVRTGRTDREIKAGYQCSDGEGSQLCEGYEHFAGCFYDGSLLYSDPVAGAQSCFPDNATDPVFDIGGTREVRGELPTGFDDYRACLNFRPANILARHRFEADQRLERIDNDYDFSREDMIESFRSKRVTESDPPPREIPIFISDGDDEFVVTMADVLHSLGWNEAENPLGWKDVLGRFLLRDDEQRAFNIAINHEKVTSVRVEFERDDKKSIPSIRFHKEPTTETLSTQAQNLTSKDLPVDNPRFVSFQTRTGRPGRVVYPDLFYAENVEEFQGALQNVERQLREFLGGEGVCNDCLIQEIANTADAAKLRDALAWRQMDLDTKHLYLLQTYLDSRATAYVGELNAPYELAYVNGEGDAAGYEFLLGLPEVSGRSSGAGAVSEEVEVTVDDDPNNPFDDTPRDPPSRQGGYDLFSWSPPPISPWWERMKEWAASLKETSFDVSFGNSADDFYAKQEADLEKEREKIATQQRALEQDPALAEDLQISRIASVQLESDSLMVSIGREFEIGVAVKDAAGELVTDEFARVTLDAQGLEFVQPDEDGSAEGYQITVIGGRAAVRLRAPNAPGRHPISIKLPEPALETNGEVRVIPSAALTISAQTPSVIADGRGLVRLEVKAVDDAGDVIESASGDVSLALSDAAMGGLAQQTLTLSRGRGAIDFAVGTKAGVVFVNATALGLKAGEVELELLPGAPSKLTLESSAEKLPARAGSSIEIRAALIDAHGNLVTTNSTKEVTFALVENSDEFAAIADVNVTVRSGVAATLVSPRDKQGLVTIEARSEGLAPARIELKPTFRFDAHDVRSMQFDALATALLGIPAGDVSNPDALAPAILSRGSAQVVTTLTTPAAQPTPLVEIGARGGLKFPAAGRISARFIPANNFAVSLHDDVAGVDIGTMMLVARPQGAFEIIGKDEDIGRLADGVYVRKLLDDSQFQVDRSRGALRLVEGGNERFEIQMNGFVRLFDNAYSLTVEPGEFMQFRIEKSGQAAAQVIILQRLDQDVRVVSREIISSPAPGVYVSGSDLSESIKLQTSFSGNSTNSNRSALFVDTALPLEGPAAGGFSFRSLEDSSEDFGVGFTQDNKFALLFAAGEIFGESSRPYGSDIGIVMGDPTVRLKIENDGFTSDVGKMLYTGASDIRQILPFDYNSDGFKDILLVHEDAVRLIHNNGGIENLRDSGWLLRAANGIADAATVDFNNDGQEDIVLATRESCRRGDTCLDVYQNASGQFTRSNLTFPQTEKIVTVRARDLNGDRFPELVFADASGDIKIIYNRAGRFDAVAQTIGNIGIQVDPTKNLIAPVAVHYSGMPRKRENEVESLQNFVTIAVIAPNPRANAEGLGGVPRPGGGGGVRADNPTNTVDKDFIYADVDSSALRNSTKFAQDLTGGVLRSGDRVRYTITLRNRMGNALRMDISDVIGQQLTIDESSIQCEQCREQIELERLRGDPTRPLLMKNIVVPAGGQRVITYEATYGGQTETAEKVSIVFNSRFEDKSQALTSRLRADELPDISVSKEGNPTGSVRYFISTGAPINGIVRYTAELSTPPDPADSTDALRAAGLTIPDPDALTNAERVPPDVENRFKEETSRDSDGDGLQDLIDDTNAALDTIADATASAINKLTCNAGCLSLPINHAFLVPGFTSVLGVPTAYNIGLPVFGWGVPSLPPIWPPSGPAPYSPLAGRFYISPTLTGGLGFAVCLGFYGITPKNCWAFGVSPLSLVGDLCKNLNGGISAVLSKANDVIAEANEGLTVSVPGAGGITGTGSRESSGSGLVNYSLGSYDAPVARSRNIRVPGFPGIITDWFAAQMEEVAKALDVPDLYVLYPDFSSVTGLLNPTQPFDRTGDFVTNVLSSINSMPLFDIESEQILFKVPILTRKEVELYKADALQWIEDEKLEIDRWMTALGCFAPNLNGEREGEGGNFLNLDLCRFVSAEMNKLINSVVENMKRLDDWILFPKKILNLRAIESYYLGQILDYADTIIDFMGGWVKRNTARVKQWRRAVRQMKDALESWKALLNIMVDYKESCDTCKTDRYGLMELLIKLFLALPSPPVIPLPKLPDIVVDVSKIQTGIRIKWPDIQFKPEPFLFPRLPRIRLGVNLDIPLFKLIAPEIPLIPAPPQLPSLPPLPPLQTPQLPDLPPPPTLPSMPNQLNVLISMLKKIFKIVCLVTQGVIPVDEVMLKSRIEQITARGLTPILPIDLLFSIQSPSISITYLDQLIIRATTNFPTTMKTDFVTETVQEVADVANAFSTSLVKEVNTYTQALMKEIEKYTSPTIDINTRTIGEPRRVNQIYLEATSEPYVPSLRAQRSNLALRRHPEQAARDLLDPDAAKALSPLLQQRNGIAARRDYVASLGNELMREPKIEAAQSPLAADVRPTRFIVQAAGGSAPEAAAASPQINNVGIFYADPSGASRRLIDYTLEANSVSRLADIDLDNDGDTDKLYSYGANLFGKRSGRRAPSQPAMHFRDDDIEIKTLFELTPVLSAPLHARITEESSREVRVSMEAPALARSEIAGYEIEAQGASGLTRFHAVAEQKPADVGQLQILLRDVEGTVSVNHNPITSFALEPGDLVSVGEDATASVSASDGTRITVEENSEFIVPENNRFQLLSGEILITLPVGGRLIPSGGVIEVESGSARVRFADSSEVTVDAQSPLTIPELSLASSRITRLRGQALITGAPREIITEDSGDVHVALGDRIHPLEISDIAWNLNQPGQRDYRLSPRAVISVPQSFSEGVDIAVRSGSIEVIRKSDAKAIAPLALGMMVGFDDAIRIERGSATVQYERGGQTIIAAGETFVLKKANSLQSLSVSLTMEPGQYSLTARAFDLNGQRSTRSVNLLASPQVCGDTIGPSATLGAQEFTLAVGKTMTLDAGNSSDDAGRIISFAIDTDTTVDSDRDGDAANDRDTSSDTDPTADADGDGDPGNDADSSRLPIGPYDSIGDRRMRLIVLDEARNSATQDITVHVVTPRIVLDVKLLGGGVLGGFVDPIEENVPVIIARKRNNGRGWQLIRTGSANEAGQYLTRADGSYSVVDADTNSNLKILDAAGKTIAQISAVSGRIIPSDANYEARFTGGATMALVPKSGGEALVSVQYVPDVNVDVTVRDVEFNAQTIAGLHGVHVRPLARAREMGISFRVLPGDNRELPGAVALEREGARISVVDVNGDILPLDEKVSVGEHIRTQATPSDPVTFEIAYENTAIAEVYIAAAKITDDTIVTSAVPVTRPAVSPSPVAAQEEPFIDVDGKSELGETIQKLYSRGIVSGYKNEARKELEFRPEKQLNRAEFTQITLKMLCIIPRDEAHKLPSPFYDVVDPRLWFYPVLKEGNIRGFIKGYLGEKRANASGQIQTPFKPANSITRAEATTIVLAALAEENIIRLTPDDIKQTGGPWYEPYMSVAQDLGPYLIDADSARVFLLTPQEAAAPNQLITRAEFAQMAGRVLLMYDCYEPDRDQDGMSDVWEVQAGFSPVELGPLDDRDGDGCSALEEFKMNTHPAKPDSDGGGVNDCKEKAAGTNPANNPFDDRRATQIVEREELGTIESLGDGAAGDGQATGAQRRDEQQEGIYVIEPACNSCPCPATVEPTATISTGDKFFSAIAGPNGIPIYVRSNEIRN